MRFILRHARQSPVFSVIGLLTVAFGSGATLALLALLDALVLRPLPVPSSDRLVAAWSINDRNQQT
jgi:putative ABC transport system permease protein